MRKRENVVCNDCILDGINDIQRPPEGTVEGCVASGTLAQSPPTGGFTRVLTEVSAPFFSCSSPCFLGWAGGSE